MDVGKPLFALSLACSAVLGAACGDETIRDCGGGLFITITFDEDLLDRAQTLGVEVTVDGVSAMAQSWPATELDDTETLVVTFPDHRDGESFDVQVHAILLDAERPIAAAIETEELSGESRGCTSLDLSLEEEELDGGGGDADAGMDAGGDPDARMDAGGDPDARMDAGGDDPDAPPDAMEGMSDAKTVDAMQGKPDAMQGKPDALMPTDARSSRDASTGDGPSGDQL